MVEKQKEERSIKNNPLQKIFLISNYFEEPKEKKNWFVNQLQNYVKTIKQNVYNMTKEEKYDRLKRRAHFLSISNNKINQFPNIKNPSHKFLPIPKEKKVYLKKYNSNNKMNKLLSNNSDDFSKNNSYIFNSDNSPKSNKIENKTIGSLLIKEYSKSQKRHKYPFYLCSNNLPEIQGIENKNQYIKNNLTNISTETEIIEKKLIRQEKKKYIKFKTKYNKLYNEHKKMQIDLEQYVDPKRDRKYKFDLSQNSGDTNETHIVNLKLAMRQISNKLKNRHHNKPSLSDIIDEVENFKLREKMLRDRIEKSHEKFNYLINDSSIIQKRIDIKCQKNNEME